MRVINPTRARWTRLRHSLSAKLITLLLASLVITFALLGYLNVQLQRKHLEAATLLSAGRVSDVIKRTTAQYMLRNDRQGLYKTIQTMAEQPGMVKVRVFDQNGRVGYSTDPQEVSQMIGKTADACDDCKSLPLSQLDAPDRFRIYRDSSGDRILRVITPIENQLSCENAACHAHPGSHEILGVLDTSLSLAKADAQLAESRNQTMAYTLAAMLLIALLTWIFILRVVDVPIKALTNGTEQISNGELGVQIEVQSQDEVGDLARSFNGMSLQLRAANDEIVTWARTLEGRVSEKTRELKNAHEHVLHVEKMASIGKMAAIVAHEINNPLAGILTYSKLLRKWMDRGVIDGEKHQEALQALDLIAGESRRCGEIVKNLLSFSREAPMNLQPTDLNSVVDRSVRLIQHQLEMNGIELQLDLADDLPSVHCDPAQIEQVLLALVMNAIDAMPHGGTLSIATEVNPARDKMQLRVCDDGTGIKPEILPHIFEPFETTKEVGHGVGLGLAVSHNIIERHGGQIDVQSEVGKGTTFTVTLALDNSCEVATVGPEGTTIVRREL